MVRLHDLKNFEKDFILMADFFDFFCAESLGYGTYRNVYQFRLKDDWVIKVMSDAERNDNVVEMEHWEQMTLNNPEVAKYLAPCRWISNGGKVLIQDKTTPINAALVEKGKQKLPSMLPDFFCDTKYSNWGFIGKKLVCHDYGNHGLYAVKDFRKMVKVKWREA